VERNQLLAIVVIVVVIAGAGVAFIFLQQPTKPPENTLIWETIGNPDYLDPHVDYETFGSWICYNVYETLYTYPWDSANTAASVPLLASGPAVITNGGLNITIPLRTGVTFQDGTPFNASCVKWNIERAVKIFYLDGPVWMVIEPLKGGLAVEDAAYGSGTSSQAFKDAFDNWTAHSGAINVIDETHIQFCLSKPYAPFIAAITYEVGAMISPTFAIAHATDSSYATWAGYGVDYGEYQNYMSDHTCGTGPYEVTKWVPDQYIRLDINPNYWRADSDTSTGAGSLKTIFIKTNEDVNGRILNLKAGTTDGCYWPTTNAKQIWDSATSTSLDSNIVVQTGGKTYDVMFFGFNMGVYNTTQGQSISSPFADLNFRLAASYAFDYDTFLSAAVNGFGQQARGPIPQGMFGYNATAYANINFNLTKAVEYWNLALQNSSLVDTLNTMGDTLTIYYNSGNTVREQGSLLLADGLTNMTKDANAASQTGAGLTKAMTFQTQALEWSNYLDHIRNRQMPIFFVGWAPDYADPDDYVFPFCDAGGTYALRIGFNNTEVNNYYSLAKTATNQTLRMEYYNKINDICAAQAPYLWAYQAVEFTCYRAWLHGDGLIYNPMHDQYFYNMYKDYGTT